jgi:catechol 2,3-dioxygenase-like lactoylglutathione lyase family enzyme
MAKPSKFAHIVYRTRRFEDMIAWYQKVFEAKVQYQNPALAFLTYDEEHHRFAFANLSILDPAGKGSGGKMDAGVDHVLLARPAGPPAPIPPEHGMGA